MREVNDKSIIRVQKRENPYFVADKYYLSDKRLSWKAKGILTYFLSKPDNWKIYIADLINQSTDGKNSISAGLQELKQNGYLTHKQIREKGKIVGWESIVYERPLNTECNTSCNTISADNQEEKHTCNTSCNTNIKDQVKPHPDFQDVVKIDIIPPDPDFPEVENPELEKPELENQPLLINELLLNNDLLSNELQQQQKGSKTQNLIDPNIHNDVVVVRQEVERIFKVTMSNDYFHKLLKNFSRQKILDKLQVISSLSSIGNLEGCLFSALNEDWKSGQLIHFKDRKKHKKKDKNNNLQDDKYKDIYMS